MMRPAICLLLVLALAGCGGDASGAEEKRAAGAPRGAPAQEPDAVQRVVIRGFTYRPARVVVAAGGAVTWIDRDTSNHTVSFEEPDIRGIGNLRPGRRGVVTFNKRGTFTYICDFHPGMAGSVEVR